MSCRLLLTMFFIGLVCPNIHAGDPIWRIRPEGIPFPLQDQSNMGPGPGGLVRRYSLAQVFVDGTAGNPGLVETITVFFVDDAPLHFGTMQGSAILNVFTVDGPAGLPMPFDNPDNGVVVEATFTQNKVDGWIEVQATNLSALPIPVEIKKGVRYYIGLTPVFFGGNPPFGGQHIANGLGKANESQSAFRETSPVPGNWIFAGDLFGPPPELFATIEIEPGDATGCESPLGDVNGDGAVTLADVAPFVAQLTGGGFQCEADINQDAVVNLLDVGPFIAILSGG